MDCRPVSGHGVTFLRGQDGSLGRRKNSSFPRTRQSSQTRPGNPVKLSPQRPTPVPFSPHPHAAHPPSLPLSRRRGTILAYCEYHPSPATKAGPMAEFDSIAKHLIHTYPADFARFALQQDDVQILGVVDTEQPTAETHRTDSLIRVHVGGEEVLVHHEFQTTDSKPPMPRRMIGYIGRGIEQHNRPIYSNVIYLRPDAGRNDPGHYVQERHGYRVLVQYKVIRLIEIDGQRILDAGPSGLLPFAPLMQPPAGVDAEGWLRQCVNRAQQVPMDERRKANYMADLAMLSGLVYNLETIMTIIEEETMYESSVAQYFTEKGIERGGRERTIEALLEVLEIRFGLAASDPLAARIEATDDVPRLKQLHRAAIQVPSLEAFRLLLDRAE